MKVLGQNGGGRGRKWEIFLAFCQRHKMSTSPYSGCEYTHPPPPKKTFNVFKERKPNQQHLAKSDGNAT